MEERDLLGAMAQEEEAPSLSSGEENWSSRSSEATDQAREAEETVDPRKAKEVIEDFRRRNAGLQRRLQQELQARRELEERLRQFEQLAYAQTLQNLPPEERLRRLHQFQQYRGLEERERRLAEMEQELEQKAKLIVAMEFSRRYGVPVEELLEFETPEAMEKFAKRAGRPAPRFERSETAPPSREKPKDLDEAVQAFRRAARRMGLA